MKVISTSIRLTVEQWLALRKQANRQRCTLSALLIARATGEPVVYQYARKSELLKR